MPEAVGSIKTHQVQRQKLRKKLRARGVAEAEIERCVEEMRARQVAARAQAPKPSTPPKARRARRPKPLPRTPEEQERIEAETYARWALDDRGYRPAKPDPLLTGPARVTGVAAKAVRRGTAITQWQHGEAEHRPDRRVPR